MEKARDRTILVVDGDPAWERLRLGAHRVVRVAPGELRPHDTGDAAVVLVNLAAPGSIDAIASWPRRGALAPSACVTVPGSEQVVLLRGIAVVAALRPADPVALHVRRRRRRHARIVATGPNAGALLALRRVLAADGIGVSLAWDDAQARDLCELVHPHVLVVDLGLARGGHDLVLWIGRQRSVPDLVLVPAGNDAHAFAAGFAQAARREAVPLRRDALAALVAPPAPGLRTHVAQG